MQRNGQKMEKNTKILVFCGIQVGIFLLFLGVLLLHWQFGVSSGNKLMTMLWISMIFLVLVGCAVTLVTVDYLRGIVKSASADVVGVHNKKALEKKIQELQECDDTFDLGIMMFDLNNLKKVNDNYGHEQGDLFIKTFASYLARILTSESYLARYGGDEFVIVQEHTNLKQLEEMNHRLQELIDDYNRGAEHEISYAVGYEVSYRNHYYLVPDLMRIADEKMYEDKRYKKRNLLPGQREYGSDSEPLHNISTQKLAEKIHTAISNSKGRCSYALLMTDVQDFRLINDYWGYEIGNQILDKVQRLMKNLENVRFACHFHSDVFACLVDVAGMEPQDFIKNVEICKAKMEEQVILEFSVNYFVLNTGIYFISDEKKNPEEIISHANTVRRKAKENDTGVAVYDKQVEAMELRRADILNSFQKAIDQEEFQIYFQPKIESKSQQIDSAEVLVRWQKSSEELRMPDTFLPVLEENGEVALLDFYVYEKAFEWLEKRYQQGKKVVPLSLNVSTVHFHHIEKFEEWVEALFYAYDIAPRDVVFEITETVYIHNIAAVNHMIHKFHEAGIRISMDDFGSGYSSLNTLKDILFDEVKMDKSFLDEGLSVNGKIVIEEIFHLLKRTHKSIVCEGVETKEVADFLIEAGCNELQGYYYYKPMPMEAFEEVL